MTRLGRLGERLVVLADRALKGIDRALVAFDHMISMAWLLTCGHSPEEIERRFTERSNSAEGPRSIECADRVGSYPHGQAFAPEAATSRRIRCLTHGAAMWTGQVICVDCGAVWHLNKPEGDSEIPAGGGRLCTCGADLRVSARPLCPQCYDEQRPHASH